MDEPVGQHPTVSTTPRTKPPTPTTDEATTKNPNNEKPTQKAGRGSSILPVHWGLGVKLNKGCCVGMWSMVVLPPLQYSIVKALVETNQPIDADSLASKLGKRAEDIMRDLEELRSRGLVNLEHRPVNKVSLTSLGEAYLKNGLPEERLLSYLRSIGGRAKVGELARLTGLSDEEFAAALGRLRRLNAISLTGDSVTLTGVEEGLRAYV
ncbi:MAG: hypothetical protein RXN84_06730, partial [Caldivirga sp.]